MFFYWVVYVSEATFWWIVEFFWFALAIYGLPLTLAGSLLAKSKEYKSWLSGKKGYQEILCKLPGVNLKGYKSIRNSTIFYIGLPSLVLLIFMFQQYPVINNLGYYSIKGIIGLVILYLLFIERPDIHWNFGVSQTVTIEQLLALSPDDFERLVAKVFNKAGYQVKVTGRSGDGGVDIEIKRNSRVGIVQCKRYEGRVEIEKVRELFGTMVHKKVDIAFLVTSGHFSEGARQFIRDKPINLIDGQTLCKLIHRYPP